MNKVIKQRDLLKKISQAAQAQGKTFDLVRLGARHDVYRLGSEIIPVPRHTEIEQSTAEASLMSAIQNLGKGR